MRHRFFHLDPDFVQSILDGLSLERLFNQLLLAAGGDVEDAMTWMRELQDRGYIDSDVDLEAFFDGLEDL